jgi:hypothetical protein
MLDQRDMRNPAKEKRTRVDMRIRTNLFTEFLGRSTIEE